MNYYEHHLGDWAAATGHLSWDEDMAYTRLLRAYYHAEKAIPEGQQYRLAKASSTAQRKAVDAVLSEFFELRDGSFYQKRADAEIARFHAGEPEREARRANEEARMKRHRDERAKLFRILSDSGVHAAWNVGMNELRELAKRCGEPLPATAPATPATATHTHTPDTRHHSPEENTHTPTACARVCVLLRREGVSDVNPGHPGLMALVAAGCSDAEFTGAAVSAVGRGKGFAYLLGTLKRQREEAAKAVLHTGPMPSAETPYARHMRERMEEFAPEIAAKRPGTKGVVIDMESINAVTRRLG